MAWRLDRMGGTSGRKKEVTRLQKLYDCRIPFRLHYGSGTRYVSWILHLRDGELEIDGWATSMVEAIDAIWAAAKEDYPDAECFKENK